jgi:hypothetical protein
MKTKSEWFTEIVRSDQISEDEKRAIALLYRRISRLGSDLVGFRLTDDDSIVTYRYIDIEEGDDRHRKQTRNEMADHSGGG